MSAIQILKEKLVGNFYSRFSVGDAFDLYFDGFWLITNNIESPDEGSLNQQFAGTYQPTTEAIDKEDIAKTIILCSTLRKNIVDVTLSKDSALILKFENGVDLVFPTNTEIVDWHWAINENGNDPFLGCIVGCFSPGEIYIGNC
ncbi:hypothetical protein HNP49_003170 [Pseudomonas fluvialis]|uniref:Uncharacterized protein n=1 Tax=Pseudomonas fluvialis TaxID=1793966 RepID=A0A7X0BUK5_9PSED|nr:hypothetical protein [Pseudomonas fluvialis]MBB6342982.1 hypothetical protein [Pseudomonas fluvialis]